jgi:(2Fe-2S) ferredoxin
MEPYRLHIFSCTHANKPQHCGNNGGREVFEAFKTELARRGLADVRITDTGCHHEHHHGAPIVVVYPEGVWYAHIKPEDVPEIIECHVLGGRVVERLLYHKPGI